MKRFIKKVFLFLLVISCVLCIQIGIQIRFIGNQFEEYYTASILDKLERLESIKEPKMILAGNSNVAFGISSEMLSEAMNMPVVNLGLHGGLGNAFHENMAKVAINEGDIVVVCATYFGDDAGINDAKTAWITYEWHQKLWREGLIDLADIGNFLLAYPDYARRAVMKKIEGKKALGETSYAREAFNEYGDIVRRTEECTYVFDENSVKEPEIDAASIARLNKLNSFIKNKGAVMLVAGYPIGEGVFTPDQEVYEKFQKKLEKGLDCAVISDFTDYFIPYEYFYDTELHLTEEGAKIRTAQLIKDLQQWKRGIGK